ncbi:MAG: TRAM domain-containing protein, partial [Syntrophomonadaceae bacterium]|nr:TRAM domain-containing protein [Syntrophomonadaceae bacterium]
MRLNITGLTPQGEGIARVDNKVVFIPCVLPGETVEAEIISEKARYSRGRIKNIIEAVPERIEPQCPYFFECGGCQYQHVNYKTELVYKVRAVQETLARIAHIGANNLTIEGDKQPWHYRNKATWHLKAGRYGKLELGFYRAASQSIVPVTSCILLNEKINEV